LNQLILQLGWVIPGLVKSICHINDDPDITQSPSYIVF
jgi:hypothetical protein